MRLRAFVPLLFVLPSLASADGIDDLVKANMEKYHVPGLALGIAVDGKLVEQRCYGYSNLETMTPVTPQTVFKIASLSKAFCASTAMLLIQEGKLSLDAKVTDVLPEAPRSWEKVQIKHLLSHTSGIPDPQGFTMSRSYTVPEFFALFGELSEEPGTVYRYNNFGYATLGLVVAKITGKTLREAVTERIFEPLGMSATHYYDMQRLVPSRANGYNWNGTAHVNVNALRPLVYDGSGGVLTSLEDYAKWDAALRTDKPLNGIVRRQMWTIEPLADGKPGGYGFGWFPDKLDEQRVVHHNGTTTGFTAHVIRGLDDGVTVFVFRNVSGTGAYELAEAVFKAYRAKKQAA
jgi:CubicO group peptidase (beta-lactamase class C family)